MKMKENKEKTTKKTKQMVIRSVDIEAVTAANMCAKKAKKRIGQWVSEIFLKAAKEELTKKTEVAKPEDVRDVLKDFVKKLEDVGDDLKKVTVRLEEPWHKRFFRRKDK